MLIGENLVLFVNIIIAMYLVGTIINKLLFLHTSLRRQYYMRMSAKDKQEK